MALRNVKPTDPQKAWHFAAEDFPLRVIAISPHGEIPYGGIPAVLTEMDEGSESFYSAEIKKDGEGTKEGEWIAYFVNGYGDEGTARADASRRDWRQSPDYRSEEGW